MLISVFDVLREARGKRSEGLNTSMTHSPSVQSVQQCYSATPFVILSRPSQLVRESIFLFLSTV